MDLQSEKKILIRKSRTLNNIELDKKIKNIEFQTDHKLKLYTKI